MTFMDYERPSVATDIVLLRTKDVFVNNRIEDKKELQIMLVKRTGEPFKNKWALPGGFVNIDKTIEETIDEKVLEKCGVKDFYKEQLFTFDNPERDKRWRVISTAFIGIANSNLKHEKVINNQDSVWFTINGNTMVSDNEMVSISMDELAFDHKIIVNMAIERIRNKLFYTDIGFNFVDKKFTVRELKEVFELLNGNKIDNFKRIMSDKIEETDEVYKGKACRPAKLYVKK